MLVLLALLACDTEPAVEARRGPPNVVFVSIDGLRYDRTGLGGHDLPTTPTLDHLATLGVSFDRAFSTANESVFSHASMLTSRYTSEVAHPEYLAYVVPEDATLLPEVLEALGYETGAFVGGGHVRETFGFDQGFDHWMESEVLFGSFYETGAEAMTWLDERTTDAPFFVFLHGYDPHRPYLHTGLFTHPFGKASTTAFERLIRVRNFTDMVFEGVVYPAFELAWVEHVNGDVLLSARDYERIGEEAASLSEVVLPLTDDDLEHVDRHYDSSVLCADTYVGLFLEGLHERGLWDDTLVVITSDHGEDMQDHGFYNHRAVLMDSTTRVPLLITGGAVPEALWGTRVPWVVDSVDLVPTILDVVGTVPPAGSRGRALLELVESGGPDDDRASFQEGVLGHSAIRVEDWRLIFHGGDLTAPDYLERMATSDLADAFALYHLPTDPTEQTDVLADHLDTAESLRARLVRWRAGIQVGTARQELDPALKQQLQERGYW